MYSVNLPFILLSNIGTRQNEGRDGAALCAYIYVSKITWGRWIQTIIIITMATEPYRETVFPTADGSPK